MNPIVRRIFSVTSLALAPLMLADSARAQESGFFRLPLGRFAVTALYDGVIDIDAKTLTNLDPADRDRFRSSEQGGKTGWPTAVNAYLVDTGRNLVLVDSGAAGLFGPTLGAVARNLKAAGYVPESIDTVLLTHLHADHMGGLNDADGVPVFANATVRVAQTESDFWLSREVASAMPDEYQQHFRMARESAAPYKRLGRWQTFAAGSQLLPGIRAVDAGGHTPGHSAFAIESDGEQLLIWGDLVHVHTVQFSRPEVAVDFDFDARQAVETRRAMLKEVADGNTVVAGAHLPFPGFGHVRSEDGGTYRWETIADSRRVPVIDLRR